MSNEEQKAYRNNFYFTLGPVEGIEDPVGAGSSVTCTALGDAEAYRTIWRRAREKYKTDAGYLSWQDLSEHPSNQDPARVYSVWGADINKYALAVGVDPLMVAAFMTHESYGDCCAVGLDSAGKVSCPSTSPGGALCGTSIGYGLMQITSNAAVPPVTISSRHDLCGGKSVRMNQAIRGKWTSTVAKGGTHNQPNDWLGPGRGALNSLRSGINDHLLKRYQNYIKYKAACDAVVPDKTCVWWIAAGYNGGSGYITDNTFRNKLADGGIGNRAKGVYLYANTISKLYEKIRTTLMG